MTVVSDTWPWDDSEFGISEKQMRALMMRIDSENDGAAANVSKEQISADSDVGASEKEMKIIPSISGRNLDSIGKPCQNLKAAAHIEVATAACVELMTLLGSKRKPTSARKLEVLTEEKGVCAKTPQHLSDSSQVEQPRGEKMDRPAETLADTSQPTVFEAQALGKHVSNLVHELTARLHKAKEEANEALETKLELQATFAEEKRRWEKEKIDMCQRWEAERSSLLEKLESCSPAETKMQCLKNACRSALGQEPQHVATQTIEIPCDMASEVSSPCGKTLHSRSAPCSRRGTKELESGSSPRATVLRVARAFGDEESLEDQLDPETPERLERPAMPDVNECVEKMRAPLRKQTSFLAEGSVSEKAAQFESEVHRRSRNPSLMSVQRSNSFR
jgi:hypothetical protein